MSQGFPLGAKTTAPPAFGTGSITFGTPSAQAQPNFGFGATAPAAQPASGFQFGSSAPLVTTASVTSLLATPSNLNFKPNVLGTTTQSSLFGAAASTAPVNTSGFAFGSQPVAATTAAPVVGFGLTNPTAAPTFPFGTTTATSTGFAVGTPATSSFGGTSGGGLFGTTTSAPGLTFGTPITSASTLGLGIAAPTSLGLTFGLGGSTTQPFNLATTTTAPAVIGLGGTATTQAKLPTQKEVPPKDQALPNEILQTVDQFKEMVKQQKIYSSDIARCSVRDFRKVEQEIDQLANLLNEVENQLQKNRHLAEQLKYDTAMCLQNVEMAQRTQDIPPGLQYEHTAPLRYFLQLADQFETEMQVLKFQIECADKYVKNHRSPDVLTPQDLSLGMRRLHETFVALAGRLHSVHSQVESQKEVYLNIRKQIYNDPSNPFEKLNKQPTASTANPVVMYHPKVATGPTPFSNLVLGNGNPLILQQQNQTNPYMGQATTPQQTGFGNMTFGSNLTSQPLNTSLMPNSMFGTTAYNTSSNFQLQKPPTGNKRGKQ